MVECVITSPTLRKADRYEKRRQRKNVVNKWKLVQLENAGSDRLSPKFEYRALPLPFATPVAAQETCIQIVLDTGAYFIDGGTGDVYPNCARRLLHRRAKARCG